MANSFFKFKQFTVHQENCAMKVSTDACLLGALAAQSKTGVKPGTHRVLDIGCGTGLLALMYAQQHPFCVMDAVEVDGAAAAQARHNCMESPFAQQIRVHHTNILDFTPPEKYDVIISNPPFYEGQLPSNNRQKNIAHHSSLLILPELLQKARSLLQEGACLWLLLPFNREAECLSSAAGQGLLPHDIYNIRQTTAHGYFRSAIKFVLAPHGACLRHDLAIKNKEGGYTVAFTQIMEPYYLHL